MDGPTTEVAVPIVSGETTPPQVATLVDTLARGAKREDASTADAVAAAIKLAADANSGGAPADKED